MIGNWSTWMQLHWQREKFKTPYTVPEVRIEPVSLALQSGSSICPTTTPPEKVPHHYFQVQLSQSRVLANTYPPPPSYITNSTTENLPPTS